MIESTIKLQDIKIYNIKFKREKPSEKKMAKRRMEYAIDKKLCILIRQSNNELVKGFTYYTLAQELNLSTVPCTYLDEKEYTLYMNSSKKITEKDRRLIFKNYKWNCYICNNKITTRKEERNYIDYGTIDHIVPKAKGGKNKLTNLACCCLLCNSLKGNATLTNKLKRHLTKQKEIAKKHHIKTLAEYQIMNQKHNL